MKNFSTILGTLLLACGPVMAADPAPTPAAAHFEVKFMTDMIDHHHMAVMMAEHCLMAAVRPELKTLCQNIIDTQTKEIHMMHSWLESWYDITYKPDMKMHGDMRHMMSMTGEMFEIEFMQMMIRHRFKAVKEAEQCERRVYHTELIHLCHNIEATQTQEIRQMQTWLCAWYSICNWGPKV